MIGSVSQHIREHIEVIGYLEELLVNQISMSAKLLVNLLATGESAFGCGNGGSAADSQHLATELFCRFKKDRKALRSNALTTDTTVFSCIANDYSYEDIFSTQLWALARPDDVLATVSTSGNS